MYDLIVIGGGASGMLASILAGKAGLKTLLLEKNNRVGKKLLTTGNSRCNFTNKNIKLERYHGQNTNFIKSLIERYDYNFIKELFFEMGIESFYVEENGKAYPNSLQASTFLDVLRFEMDEAKVVLITDENIKDLSYKNNFTVYGKEAYNSRNVIVATGGMSMPKNGSDGGRYKFLKKFGHRDIKTLPALTQLKLENPHARAMDGVKLENTNVSLYVDGEFVARENGDFLFTSYGASGPTVLYLSRKAVVALDKNRKVELGVEIREGGELYSRFKSMNQRTLEEAMVGLINKKLIIPILKGLELDWNMPASNLKNEGIKEIENRLSDFRARVVGHTGFGNSQVTNGGISTDDFDPNTMESRLQKGLYAVGEVLDIDGDSGGFNLHFAWASALAAVEAIKETI